MPDNLRRTVLYAAALQALGSSHTFTNALEGMLSRSVLSDRGSSADDELSALPDADRGKVLERYRAICRNLPIDQMAA